MAAFSLLAADLAAGDLSDPALHWRLDAQLRQLAWDRELAALYLESWGGNAPAALAAGYRTVAHTARTLLSRNWERRSASLRTLDALRALVEGSAAYAYALPDNPALLAAAARAGLGAPVSLADGPALLVDTPARRQGAVALTQRLSDLEQSSAALLRTAFSAL
jgi:hypothetical protein